jgi:hypothetical protein
MCRIFIYVPVNEFPLLSGNITRNVKETVQEKTGNRREDLHRCQEFTAQRPTSLVIGALPSTDNAKLCIHRNTVTSESTLAPANMWSSFTGKCPKKCSKRLIIYYNGARRLIDCIYYVVSC